MVYTICSATTKTQVMPAMNSNDITLSSGTVKRSATADKLTFYVHTKDSGTYTYAITSSDVITRNHVYYIRAKLFNGSKRYWAILAGSGAAASSGAAYVDEIKDIKKSASATPTVRLRLQNSLLTLDDDWQIRIEVFDLTEDFGITAVTEADDPEEYDAYYGTEYVSQGTHLSKKEYQIMDGNKIKEVIG